MDSLLAILHSIITTFNCVKQLHWIFNCFKLQYFKNKLLCFLTHVLFNFKANLFLKSIIFALENLKSKTHCKAYHSAKILPVCISDAIFNVHSTKYHEHLISQSMSYAKGQNKWKSQNNYWYMFHCRCLR